MSNADAAWLSYTATLTTTAADLPSTSTMHTLRAAGRVRSVTLWTLRYLLSYTTRLIPAMLADACRPDASPDRVVHLISAAHAEYLRALARLKHVSICFSPSAAPTASPSRSSHPPTNVETVCQRFTHRLRAHLQAHFLTPRFSLAVYRMFKARVAKGRPKQIEHYLIDLGFARLTDDALSWAVFEQLDALVASHVSSPAVRAVPDLLRWVREFTESSASASSPPSVSSSPSSPSSLWTKRLEFRLHESVCDSRTDQLLTLIEQFPRSIPALHDLRDCFRCTDRKPFVAQSLQRQFEKALLNAGTQTADILQRYVSTIRTLRFLDPSGVVLACVSAPIRAYLRRRPDTVRCIVSGMTGDGDLYEELQRGRDSFDRNANPNDGAQPTTATTATSTPADTPENFNANDTHDHGNEDDEDHDCQSIDGDLDVKGRIDVADYHAWEPEPIDAPVLDNGHWRRRGGDAIATLVNIYGSSEQIVAQYRALLADKLVSQFDVDIAREERILSLLTERFGKTAMHDCVIMLKDVKDSRAVLNSVDERRGQGKENKHETDNGRDNQTSAARTKQVRGHNGEEEDEDEVDDSTNGRTLQTQRNHQKDEWFDATVISREFWPRIGDEGAFHAPNDIQLQMQTFANAFGRTKKARKLKWLHGLGACRVHLEFDDGRAINATVSPMQAAALDVFGRVGRIALTDLAKQLGVEDQAVLRRRVVALANRGILRLVSPGVYEPVEDGRNLCNGSGSGNPAINASGMSLQQRQQMNGNYSVEIDVDEDDEDDVYGDGDDDADGNEGDDVAQKEMAVYETYIIAMLTNLKQLSLEQIHTMLKRFVQTPVYDKTQTQLANFLVTLVEKDKVEVAAGIYKVKKKG